MMLEPQYIAVPYGSPQGMDHQKETFPLRVEVLICKSRFNGLLRDSQQGLFWVKKWYDWKVESGSGQLVWILALHY